MQHSICAGVSYGSREFVAPSVVEIKFTSQCRGCHAKWQHHHGVAILSQKQQQFSTQGSEAVNAAEVGLIFCQRQHQLDMQLRKATASARPGLMFYHRQQQLGVQDWLRHTVTALQPSHAA